ncbi:PE domain-containing protein [Mycobacterium sp. E2497]|uniref:PE domain-containing protein n=1 Tax=Mycobacterium sp. E2497 TaxID=1834135 RepID=UPI0007FDE2F1|nr:PE domain-containing protein [Mycobacterium sp. E2497]OBI22578.1 hypothetical protein A5713_10755 [Mycobacterium sp. E2497]
MSDNAALSIRPSEVAEVSNQLATLADRIERVIADETANLTVTASGRDEVSERVAATLNDVYRSFAAAAGQGAGQLHDVGATLRAQSGSIATFDGDAIT